MSPEPMIFPRPYVTDASGQPLFDHYDAVEREQIVGYLRGATRLLSSGRTLDKLASITGGPERRLPLTVDTDGTYVFNAGVMAHYVSVYGVKIDPEFEEHMRAGNFVAPEITEPTTQLMDRFETAVRQASQVAQSEGPETVHEIG